MTEIIVMSRETLNNFSYVMPNRYAVISISSTEQDAIYSDKFDAYTMGVLRLAFYDIDEDIISNGISYNAMNQSQADKVAIFVRYWFNKVNYLIVQCDAGISRSAGIAAAISKWAINDDMEYFHSGRYVPNRRCYRMVINSLMAGEYE